ncbi:MAG: DUF58 domain-containing protein [Treponemataceae bacterium]|nr:DUF58 domain-containing protein [Treponemataceae bacterium]
MKKESLLISDSNTLAKSAASLRLRARSIAEGLRQGNFSSMFKGQGIDFAGVREYLHGDDIRSIDWNVTARMGRPFVKLYDEEREQIVFFIVDRSLSMETGSSNLTRLNLASETGALLLLAANSNSCPVGCVFFDGKINFSCMPKNSLDQTMLILSKFANREEKVSTGSALASAIKGAEQILKNRSMIFILSDFRCPDYQDNLARLSQKHDVVAIRFTDANDFELPDFGMIGVQDPETNEKRTYPTFSSNFKRSWRENSNNVLERWKHMCKKNGVIPLIISTADDPALRLSRFFAIKEKV